MQEQVSIPLHPGAFAENVLCEGITLAELPIGTKLQIGSALCEVTQIGKECHADCAIRQQAGDCVMPREGIFAVVLEAGEARIGDMQPQEFIFLRLFIFSFFEVFLFEDIGQGRKNML